MGVKLGKYLLSPAFSCYCKCSFHPFTYGCSAPIESCDSKGRPLHWSELFRGAGPRHELVGRKGLALGV